jgi:pimeloyl-ACP methyl ester carboxylesterase
VSGVNAADYADGMGGHEMARAGKTPFVVGDLADWAAVERSGVLDNPALFTTLRRGKPDHPNRRMVVLVHGLWSGADTWEEFLRAAYASKESAEFDFGLLDYDTSYLDRILPLIRKVDAVDWSEVLADTIETYVLKQFGYESVVLVGHSMGGLVSKLAVKHLIEHARPDLRRRIHSVFTYGTPHYGSDRASVLGALFSSDVAFLRGSSKPIEQLAQFWNSKIGTEEEQVAVHERAVVSAGDVLVTKLSAAGGLPESHILSFPAKHTRLHRPADERDPRITWFWQEVAALDRLSSCDLIDIRDLPGFELLLNQQVSEFLEGLFNAVFVLDAGASDGVKVDDQFQLFYDVVPIRDKSGAARDLPPREWSMLEATVVKENVTYAKLTNFSYVIAFDRLSATIDELGLEGDDEVPLEILEALTTRLFGDEAGRIPRADTDAARRVSDAYGVAIDSDASKQTRDRALRDMLRHAIDFRRDYPSSVLLDGVVFHEAWATKELGRLEEAEQLFTKYRDAFPFATRAEGAKKHVEEIRLRLAVQRSGGAPGQKLALAEHLMPDEDAVEMAIEALVAEPGLLPVASYPLRVTLFGAKVGHGLAGNIGQDPEQFSAWLRSIDEDDTVRAKLAGLIEQVEDEGRRGLYSALLETVPGLWVARPDGEG